HEHRPDPRRKGRPSARALTLRAAGAARALDWGHRSSAARAAREHRTGPRRKGRPSARALELADGVRGHRRSGARAAREHRTGPRKSLTRTHSGLLRLGTRGSALARAQAALVHEALVGRHPALRVETVYIRTSGDRGEREAR